MLYEYILIWLHFMEKKIGKNIEKQDWPCLVKIYYKK